VSEARIGVLGLGNLMRTDDAVGMVALARLRLALAAQAELSFADGADRVELIEGGTLGLDLLDAVHGVSHLLVLDAVDAGAAPGTVMRLEGEEVARLPKSKSVHLLGLGDLMEVLLLMDAPPSEVVLLGVQPASTGWGTELTAAVAAAQSGMVDAALMQIARWRGEITDAGSGAGEGASVSAGADAAYA
jgi:hydrogenase maturation protease